MQVLTSKAALNRLFACFVLSLSLFLLGAAPVADQQTLLTQAYLYLAEENLTAAEQALSRADDSAEKHFIHACLRFKQGDLERALYYLDVAKATAPDFVEAEVFRNFFKRRWSNPEEAWIDALLASWNAAGSPELSTPYNTEIDWDSLKKERPKLTGTAQDVLLYDIYDPEATKAERLQRYSEHVRKETPKEVKLILFGVMRLNRDEVDPQTPEILLRMLTKDYPEDAIFRLMLIYTETKDKELYDLSDLERFENALKSERFSPTFSGLARYCNDFYSNIGLDFSGVRALSMSYVVSVDFNLPGDFYDRAKNAALISPPEIRKRWGTLLIELGKGHLQRETILDFYWAAKYFRIASEVNEDKDLDCLANKLVNYARDLLGAAQISDFYYLAPFKAMREEAFELGSKSEVEFYRKISRARPDPELEEFLVQLRQDK